MATKKKAAKKKVTKKKEKPSRAELWKRRQAYLDSLNEEDLEPNWKEKSEAVLKAIVKGAKPKKKASKKSKK
jgi:hypothetical protein